MYGGGFENYVFEYRSTYVIKYSVRPTNTSVWVIIKEPNPPKNPIIVVKSEVDSKANERKLDDFTMAI